MRHVCCKARSAAPTPSCLSKKNRFRKSLNTSPPGFSSSNSGPANCCVVDRAANRWRAAKRDRPSSVSVRRFTSANRTCSMTCWLVVPPGTCSKLMTWLFAADALAISPARSITAVLET